MRTAEGVTRVLEIAVVGKICSIQGEQPALPYAFAKREIKGGMRRQVPGPIPIEESRSVLVGRSSPEVVRQAQRQDPANGIPLIVVEEKVSNRRILDQTTGNGSDTLADRIRIGGTKLSHLEESWGSQRDFGALDDGAEITQGYKDPRVADDVVIEIILGAGVELVHAKRPTRSGMSRPMSC